MPGRPKSFVLSQEAYEYLLAHGGAPDAIQEQLIAATAELGPVAALQISPEQGAFMTLITRLSNARRAVEVGTFTGYSALCIARGLPADGQLLCCDISEEWTAIARRYWQEAGLEDRIELRLGSAVDTLRSFPNDPDQTGWDLAFIDADKTNYPVYWDEILTRMRPGGLVIVDNVLWQGQVFDPSVTDEDTEHMRRFNDMVAADERVDAVMIPVGDGLTLARKR